MLFWTYFLKIDFSVPDDDDGDDDDDHFNICLTYISYTVVYTGIIKSEFDESA